jgi:hypothetical protein
MAANPLLVDVRTPHPDSSVQSKAESALERVKQLEIVDAASYRMAAADLAAIKGQFKAVDAQRVELKAPSLEGCRRVDAFFAPPLNFLSTAENILKGKLDAWDKEQKRLAAVEQARLDEIARKEREKLEVKAARVEQKSPEKAQSIRQQAACIVAPMVQVDVPKVAGLSSRKNYKAKVTDLMALVKAVAEGKAPLAYVMANEVTLNKMAKALKEQMSIPGVELVEDTIKSSRALESQS